MKRLYLLIFIFSLGLSLKAQNWQTVYSDRVQYFDSSLKAIKIVSVNVDNSGDSTFKNYPEALVDSLGRTEHFYGKVVDSTSWIGRRIIIKQDGYNGFANDSLQWFWINTKANLNDTFTFFKDNRLHIQGICKNIFYKDTLGIRDSIKQYRFLFNLTHGYSFDVDTSSLKTFKILLSKHNGIIKTPAFRGFNFNWDGIRLKYFYFGEGFNHSHKNYFTNRAFNTLGVGDEFEYKITNNHDFWNNYYEDRYYHKVIKKELIKGTDSIKYGFLVRLWKLRRYKVYYQHQSNVFYWQDKIEHLVYNENRTLVVNDEPIEGLMPNQLAQRHNYIWKKPFYKNNNCDLSIGGVGYGRYDSFSKILTPPFEGASGNNLHSKIGYLSWFLESGIVMNRGVGKEYVITYKNFCETYEGSPWAKYSVFGVGVEEVEPHKIKVYPNPANSLLTISTNDAKFIELIDLQGKTVFSKAFNGESIDPINVSQLPEGIYIIKVISDNNITTQKVIIRH